MAFEDLSGMGFGGVTPTYAGQFDFGGSPGISNFTVPGMTMTAPPPISLEGLSLGGAPQLTAPGFQGLPDAGQEGQPSWLSRLGSTFSNQDPITQLSLALTGLGALGGLGGIIGGLMTSGDASSRQTTGQATTTQTTPPRTSQERTVLARLLSSMGGSGLFGAGGAQIDDLVAQAFTPQIGDLARQATEQARLQGFHQEGLQSGPAAAILGPGLSNIQGQIAAAKLALQNQLFQQQLGLLQNLSGSRPGATQTLSGTTATGPQGNPLFDASKQFAQLLGGLGGGLAPLAQAQQSNQTNALLQALLARA